MQQARDRAWASSDASPLRPESFERQGTGGRSAIPSGLNLCYAAAVILANALLFVALPLWLLPSNRWWALLALPLALTATIHWALVHEAAHGVLHPDRRWNRALGRLLGLPFLCPYEILRVGHLCHHALNGRPSDRPELCEPERQGSLGARAFYYFRLFFGLYGGELFCTLLTFVPRQRLRTITRNLAYDRHPDSLRMPDVVESHLTEPGPLRVLRIEASLIVLIVGASLALYGSWFLVLLGALLVRGLIISFLDNAPHYGTALGDIRQGHDFRLAPVWRWLVMNGNFHGTHHRHPTLPWTAWPRRFREDGASFAGSYFTLPLRQLRGPIPLQRLTVPTGS